MQDSFNSAPTPANLPVPGPAHPPSPGAAPPIYHPGQPAQPAQPGQTIPYYGPVDMDPPTVAMPPQGRASPYAPTAQQPLLPTPHPPMYPPMYPPQGFLPAPLAPRVPPAPRVVAPAPPRASRPRVAASAPAPAPAPARPGRWSAWIPLPHTLLVIGIALLYLATRLPWAVDSSGQLITLPSVSVSTLTGQDGGGTALQVANNLIGAIGALSAGLLFFNMILSGLNRLLGGGCLAGCAIIPLYPILLALAGALLVAQALAVGFGGLGALGQLPVVQSYGMGGVGVAHYEPGYYVWYTGVMLNVAGMLGEFAVRRR